MFSFCVVHCNRTCKDRCGKTIERRALRTCFIVSCYLFGAFLFAKVMLIFFGGFMELASSASEAIFADSIPAGERAGLYATQS